MRTLRARAVPQGKLPYRESGNTRRNFTLIENSEEISAPKAAKPQKHGASGEGEKQPPKDDLLRSTDPQNYAAKPRDTSKSVRAAKAGLAELANGAQDGKEILISEMNRLFGEPTKITE